MADKNEDHVEEPEEEEEEGEEENGGGPTMKGNYNIILNT